MSQEIEHKKQNLNPKFFFLSLGVIVTLITSVITSLALFFEALEKRLPDVLNSTYQYGYSSYNYSDLRGFLSTFIITFPIFLLLSFFWGKAFKKNLAGWDKTIFKWMLYLILFLASIVIIVDLVALVNYFVSGEITVRFIYKVLGTALVAGIIWSYYYLILNREKINKPQKIRIWGNVLLSISIILFINLIIFSFNVMGSPAKQRALRLDERRVNDLQTIQYQIINYWQQKEKLPTNLINLKDPMAGFSLPVDPEFQNGKVYEYIPKDKLSFEVCATFSEDMPQGWQEGNGGIMPIAYDTKMSATAYPYYGGANESWQYKKGRTCFTRAIDPEVYRPIEKIKNID